MSWKGEIAISILGFTSVSLGKYSLHRFREKQIKTVNVCPTCLIPAESLEMGDRYRCPKCDKKFRSWYQLQRAVQVGDQTNPIPERSTVKTAKIGIKLLELSEVRGLITKAEYAVVPAGEVERKNLQKLGAMLLMYNKVALFELVFRKAGDRHLMYFTVGDDGMIMVREFIPLNLVEALPVGIVAVDQSAVNEKEVEELMNALPKATEEDLVVVDEVLEALPKTPETEDLTKAIKKVMVKSE